MMSVDFPRSCNPPKASKATTYNIRIRREDNNGALICYAICPSLDWPFSFVCCAPVPVWNLLFCELLSSIVFVASPHEFSQHICIHFTPQRQTRNANRYTIYVYTFMYIVGRPCREPFNMFVSRTFHQSTRVLAHCALRCSSLSSSSTRVIIARPSLRSAPVFMLSMLHVPTHTHIILARRSPSCI